MTNEQLSTRTDGPNDPPTDITSIPFNYRGVAYTVDLDPARAAEFDRSLAPFIAAARRVGGSTRPTPTPSP
ncbi:Lsr2 dimerization domain-containing protein [Serinibacter arcticus]|uniref:Lsr2 dimerization domain-containing protein n=1 Tax=Serinibacter arcticus TaxID=1655435 RepID=A0A4Z1E558_9MICO|nr:histone-like nucleoid-structuring protein Lsr2 [Serinibacter arcticus]TGO04867.1 hypothetical protein SERN_2460 [Serinibacter arcticus]